MAVVHLGHQEQVSVQLSSQHKNGVGGEKLYLVVVFKRQGSAQCDQLGSLSPFAQKEKGREVKNELEVMMFLFKYLVSEEFFLVTEPYLANHSFVFSE